MIRPEGRRPFLLGPLELDDVRVAPADLDRRLRPVPQGLMKDRLVARHRLRAGIPEDSSVFGFAPAGPGHPRGVLSVCGLISDTETFAIGCNRWDSDKPLFVYDSLSASAWVLWHLSSWRFGVAGSLSSSLDAWLADPGLPETLDRAREGQPKP